MVADKTDGAERSTDVSSLVSRLPRFRFRFRFLRLSTL